MRAIVALALFGPLSALAVPHPSPHVVHEKRAVPHAFSNGWSLHRRAKPSHPLPIRIGLKQSNVDKLYDELLAVSDPDSEKYGRHWSPQQVHSFFKPSEESVMGVKIWLAESGLGDDRITFTTNGNWLSVDTSVEEAEELLKTEYFVYKHSSGREHIGCNQYSVPAHVQPHIDVITPTVSFDTLVHSRRRETSHLEERSIPNRLGNPSPDNGPKTLPAGFTSGIKNIIAELQNCDQMITLDCLRVLYNIVYPKPLSTRSNSFAVVEFTPQAYLPADLDMFFTNFSKSLVGKRPTLVSIDGGVVQQTQQGFNFNGESDLDLEYAMALVNPQPVTLYQAGDIPQGASFNNFLNGIDASYCTFEGGNDPTQDGIYPDPLPGGFNQPETCGVAKPANVISVSYGGIEADMTAAYSQRQCAEYGKLGLLGSTILFSSGDDGVAGFDDLCIAADGSQVPNATRFNPTFPSGCPFVTSVGATQVNPNSTVFDKESACQQVIFSGGGFSNVFAIPDYQKEVVNTYFEKFPPPYTSAQFNNSRTSRGFPDLSANGANYVIAVDGRFGRVFGTSASAPVVGSMLTLINDARLAVRKKPIGFINPAIYSKKFRGAFNDITSGGNPGCGTPGFESVPGWDPVTGLGTPNFLKLLGLWLALP